MLAGRPASDEGTAASYAMRTFAIGDIHGCLDALTALLSHIAPSAGDRLVFLGDYVDRGPRSCGVLDRVTELHRAGLAVCLLGNHEEMLLDAVGGGPHRSLWLQVGGAEALASYREETGTAEVKAEHVRFLREDVVPWFEDERCLFVHATADPDLPLGAQEDRDLRWSRFGPPAPHVSGKLLIAGHTAQKDGAPWDIGHAVCIDTYCYGGGWLTAFHVEEHRFIQANEAGEVRVVEREPLFRR